MVLPLPIHWEPANSMAILLTFPIQGKTMTNLTFTNLVHSLALRSLPDLRRVTEPETATVRIFGVGATLLPSTTPTVLPPCTSPVFVLIL